MTLLTARPASSDAGPGGTSAVAVPLGRSLLLLEVALVLAVSLGQSAVCAVVDLLQAATASGGLAAQHTVMNASLAPGRPWFDLARQLLGVAFALVPVGLAGYLLIRSGDGVRRTWLGGAGARLLTGRDLARGAGLAAAVGLTGLGFYLATHAMGLDATVVASGLPDLWWTVPVLVVAALGNALLEETVVLGFVLVRLRRIGVGEGTALTVCAVLRGAYHLYQGLGGFLGNLAMGLLFGVLYRRWGRLTPLVVTHTLLDVGAFVGFAMLAGHVGWLPA